MKITSHGHSCFSVEAGGATLLFDPFVSPNPKAAAVVDIASLRPDYILLSHGHFDHVADVETVARASGAPIIGNYEVVQWFAGKGIDNGIGMNSGGTITLPFGKVTFTPAVHSSSMPDGSYGGVAGGFRVETREGAFYYSGDTALTRDMELVAAVGPLRFAVLCIGDHFTMGYNDAATAAGWLGCKDVVGVHYDTFPPIVIDHEAARLAFSQGGRTLHLLEPGVSLEF